MKSVCRKLINLDGSPRAFPETRQLFTRLENVYKVKTLLAYLQKYVIHSTGSYLLNGIHMSLVLPYVILNYKKINLVTRNFIALRTQNVNHRLYDYHKLIFFPSQSNRINTLYLRVEILFMLIAEADPRLHLLYKSIKYSLWKISSISLNIHLLLSLEIFITLKND